MNVRTLSQRIHRHAKALSLALVAVSVLAAPPTYRLHVDGLACPFCAYGIEKKLKAIDGVAHLETSIKEGTVTVTMKDGVTLDEATAKKAVKAAGFTLNGFELVSAGEVKQDGLQSP